MWRERLGGYGGEIPKGMKLKSIKLEIHRVIKTTDLHGYSVKVRLRHTSLSPLTSVHLAAV